MTPTRDPGIRRVQPGEQATLGGVVLQSISPRVSEWLPDLLTQLYPKSVQAVRSRVVEHEPGVFEDRHLETFVSRCLQEEIFGLNEVAEWTDAHAEVLQYSQQLAELAYEAAEIEQWDDLDDDQVDVVTKIGTSEGPLNAGLDALVAGPVQLHQAIAIETETDPDTATTTSQEPLGITISLDAREWTDLDHRETGVRSLAALAALGSAFDVRLILSPSLEQHLQRRYEAWYDAHLSLTESPDTSRGSTPDDADHSERDLLSEAWGTVKQLPEGTKKARLLHHLDPDDVREYRALARDDEIGLAEGSIEPYVTELAGLGLVEMHTDRRYNGVTLTARGAVAVDRLIAPDGTVVHPSQSRLQTRLTPTPQQLPSTVYRAQWDTDSPSPASSSSSSSPFSPSSPPPSSSPSPTPSSTPSPQSAESPESPESVESAEAPESPEEFLAATGEAGADADYVQWLDGPGGHRDAYMMHQRYMAGRRGPGVTVVDDRIEEFEDGRVTYISCFEDDLLVIQQWGGPLPTLGRIAGTLLSTNALSKILTIDALGEKFENVDDDLVEDLDEDVTKILRLGHQIGWLSEDEESYDGWKERFRTVKSLCLQKVAELSNTENWDERGELMLDLHGLITSVTHLYYSIGVDITITIRMPDCKTLVSDDRRLDDFLEFVRYTVPKQTVYGVHSGYRTVIEDRAEKLRRRLPYEIDSDDPRATFTSSFVFTGPSMTDLQEKIDRAITGEQAREEIREGEVEAPAIDVPVTSGNSYKWVKELVRRAFRSKNYRVAEADDFSGRQEQELRRLARVFIRVLSTEDRPHQASPYDVVEAIQYLAKSTKAGDYARVGDIEYGLSQLPADRLLPALPPSATKMFQTILAADEPLGRSDIIDRAEISGSSYDRYITELAMLDVLEARDVDGHRRWVGSIEAWWSPQVSGEDPPDPVIEDDDLVWVAENPRPEQIVSQLALRIAKAFGNEELLETWFEDPWPNCDIGEYLGRSRRLSRWWPYIWGAIASEEDLERGPPGGGSDRDVSIPRIGTTPTDVDESQMILTDISDGPPGTHALMSEV